MNYFILRLPLTYLNAVEAQSYFKIAPDESILVILYRDIEYVDIKHIRKIINYSLWKEVHFLPYNVNSLVMEEYSEVEISKHTVLDKVKHIRRFIKKYNTLLGGRDRAEKVFIGDYNIASMRHATHTLRPKEVIILDEGFNNFRVFNRRVAESKKQISSYLSTKFLKEELANMFFGYDMRPLKKVGFFSSYRLPTDKGIPVFLNQYENIRVSLQEKQRQDGVFFLGQSFSEIHLMEEENYLEYLMNIKKWFEPKPVFYIPHRGDCAEKLERIQKEIGIEIINFDLPIEYQICVNGPLPEEIAGFNSSALQNLDTILRGDVRITSFYIDPVDVTPSKRDLITSYNDYLLTLVSKTFSVIKLPFLTR